MNTNEKGNLATAYVIADLTKRGYDVFVPVSEHGVVDLIAVKDDKPIRFQIKHSCKGIVRNGSVGRNGKKRVYKTTDFDYYGIYLSEIDIVIYIASNLPVNSIRYKQPQSSSSVWWYEDFLEIKDDVQPRFIKVESKSREHLRKIAWPDKEYLEKEIWERPASDIAKDFNVTCNMVLKWCKHYNISVPGRGYWNKRKANESSLVNRI